MTAAEVYEFDIEPKLRELAAQCKLLGFSFIAQVEIAPGKAESVVQLTPSPGAQARLANVAVLANGNFDAMAVMYVADTRRRGLIPR